MMPEEGGHLGQESASVTRDSLIRSAFRQLLAITTHRLRIFDVGVVAVIALQRYLTESQAAKDQAGDSYSYDITVTDGVCQVKCSLSPHLNHLVQKNILRTGVDVHIRQCSFVYNEKRLGQGTVCLEKMEIAAERSSILSSTEDVDALPVWSAEGVRNVTVSQSDVPTQTGRKHYLSLWNNEDPHGSLWIPRIPPTEVVLDVSKCIPLCDLHNSFLHGLRHPPLLVRIMCKSRLRFYGKLDTKVEFPFQAYFQVADHSGSVSLVLWNALCLEWYQTLNVGVVMYLQNYTLKRSFQNRSHPSLADSQMRIFSSVEICLNPRDPRAVITVIPPKCVLPLWGLPSVTYQFITSSELESLPNNSVCDVIGLVTFVGRCERIKKKANTVPEKYWTYRWVHAMDGTSTVPFVLEIFASSQPEIFHGLYPMTYLVCTQMRVCREASTLPYLTSSCETQIFTTGFHKGQPYISDPKVKSFIQWTKTLKESVILKKTVIGGHYCYPPSPPLFTQTIANDSAQYPVIAASELRQELESLQYREHKRLAIQGRITAVRFVAHSEEHNQPAEALPSEGLTISTADGHTGGVEADTLQTLANAMGPAAENPPSTQKRKKKRNKKQNVKRRYITRAAVKMLRKHDQQQEELSEEERTSSEMEEDEGDNGLSNKNDLVAGTSGQSDLAEETLADEQPSAYWESEAWETLKRDLSEHFHFDRLDKESIPSKFKFELKDYLQCQNNFHPTNWTQNQFLPDQNIKQLSPVGYKGYYQITILGINQQTAIDAVFLPVLSSEDPRSVGLPPASHSNSLLSCLASGFLYPLSDLAGHEQSLHPDPGGIIQSGAELEATPVVCLIDFCRLAGQKVEVLINKVYKMADVVFV
ncbi:RPA-related protein RADX isoform X2 [Paramormyrops kingsleyae]|uniref:RPA-related protein RADX isoform X2 n=1 Tax=Paramormyrops kingsleyae TaxID=1676925 RepID=UPI000CD5E80D|nr:RPA-related protein RADX isoform X2 [Paramormyrops kingsleyae]